MTDFGSAHFAIYCADFSHVDDAVGVRGDAGGRSAARRQRRSTSPSRSS